MCKKTKIIDYPILFFITKINILYKQRICFYFIRDLFDKIQIILFNKTIFNTATYHVWRKRPSDTITSA